MVEEAKTTKTPVKLTAEIVEQVLELHAGGEPLEQVCKKAGMPTTRALRKFKTRNPEWAVRFEEAEEACADAMAARLLDPNRLPADPGRARVVSENLRWYISRVYRRKYGDRVDVNVNTRVAVFDAFKAAEERLKRMAPDRPGDEAAVIDGVAERIDARAALLE